MSSLSSAAEQRRFCHVLRIVELREQLEVEEEDGGQTGGRGGSRKWRGESRRVHHGWNEDDCDMRSELEPWNVKCETITTVEQMRSACKLSACTPRTRLGQRRHWCSALWSAWCTRRSSFTCDAVVLIHFVLIAPIP